MKRAVFFISALVLVACAKAGTDLVTPGFALQMLAELEVYGSGNALQIREFKTKDGAHCIVANNGYRGVALQCDFSGTASNPPSKEGGKS
jgi:hypothetical protein